MADDRNRLRIGDSERDAALEMLQEHHATGRLDAAEFGERMEKALQARTQSEIDALFTDLPDPRPTPPVMPYSPPTMPPARSETNPYDVANSDENLEDPWYAQWWMILVAVGITVLTRGNAGPLVAMMAIWLWVIYPSLSSTKRRRSLRQQSSSSQGPYEPPAFARQLTNEQRRSITAELDQGRNIQAIKMYRQYTGAGLKEAKDAIDTWNRRLGH